MRIKGAAALLALLLGVGGAWATAAPAAAPSLLPVAFKCQVIYLNGEGNVFYFHQMGCHRARELATYSFREHRAPDGFHCKPRRPGTSGEFCQRDGNEQKVFGWYRESARPTSPAADAH